MFLREKILIPVLSKWLIISLGLEEANGKRFEVFNADWPAPGRHGDNTTLD
jgi:hypothetical protein